MFAGPAPGIPVTGKVAASGSANMRQRDRGKIVLFENILFAAALISPWATLIINAKVFGGKRRAITALASAVAVYSALLLGAHLADARFERELAAFDLNGDGVFTPEELSPAQEKAMENLVNDTGRALAPITGAIFSVFYVLFVLSILWLAGRAAAFIFRRGAAKGSRTADGPDGPQP
jgi:hypothetical protein